MAKNADLLREKYQQYLKDFFPRDYLNRKMIEKEGILWDINNEFKNGPFNAILHCFSSGEDLAKCGIELGFYISFSGIVTFKSAKTIQNIAKNIPIDPIPTHSSCFIALLLIVLI